MKNKLTRCLALALSASLIWGSFAYADNVADDIPVQTEAETEVESDFDETVETQESETEAEETEVLVEETEVETQVPETETETEAETQVPETETEAEETQTSEEETEIEESSEDEEIEIENATGQVYYSWDYKADVVKSRIAQKVSNDCGVVSVASAEAFKYGATSSADKTTIYNAVIKANRNNKSYAYWGDMGYVKTTYSLQTLYDRLIQGCPVIVHRTTDAGSHYSVVCAYTGSKTNLQESGFTVMDVGTAYNSSNCTMSLTAWKNVHPNGKLDQIVYRKNGVKAYFSDIKIAHNFPRRVHPKGVGHGVYGNVTSGSTLTNVSVQIVNADNGTILFNKSVNPNAKSYSLYSLDSAMTFASWPVGKYYYVVSAKDSAGRSKTDTRYFTIGTSWPETFPATPSYTLYFNSNGGTGSMNSKTIWYNNALNLPKCTFTRDGYEFVGWNAKRNSDGKWHATGKGWYTESQIASSGYTKSLYPEDTSKYIFQSSWLSGGNGPSSYTFYAVWKEKENGLPFVDVPTDAWYYDAVKYAYEEGLMTGTSATTFSPLDPMTRGMLMSILYRIEGRPEVLGVSGFPDVNEKKYYAPAITWGVAKGVVDGYSNGNFGPEDSITREQLAKIIYRYVELKGVPMSGEADLSGYRDAGEISSYARKYMSWAVANNIIKGSNKKLNPKGNATRAEVAAIMKRVIETYDLK